MIKLGPLTFLAWALGIVLTGAIIFLGIMTWEELQVPFLLFFTVPALFTLAVTRLGLTRESIFAPVPLVVTSIAFAALWINIFLLNWLFGYTPSHYSVLQQVTGYDHVLIAALFAIYEETLFLSLAALILGAGFPMVYAIAVADICFVGLHALRYPATLYYDLFLLIGRSIMTGALAYTKNADVAYSVHVLYNVSAALGGIT